MRRTLTWSLLVVLGLGLMSPAAAAVRSVTVDSFFFEDASRGDGRVVVDEGDQISFSFQGNNQHSATVDGLFDSGVKQGGQSFTTGALTRPGTYTLYCTVHGARQHSSTLIIRAAAPSSPTPKPSSAKPTPAPAKTTAAPRATTGSTAGTSTTKAATPKPASSAPAASTATPSSTPSAKAATPTGSSTATSSSPTPTASALLDEPGTSDGDGTSSEKSSRDWLLPVLLLALLLIGAGAYAFSRRSRATPSS